MLPAPRGRSFTVVIASALGALAVLAPGAQAAKLAGKVIANDHPVAASQVRVFASGASEATRIATAHTDGRGRFAVSFARPSAGDAVIYAVAGGGDTPTRKSLRLIGVAGPAGEKSRRLTINELSTVASTYSVSRFLQGTKLTGPAPAIPNAAATVANLVEAASGKAAKSISKAPNGSETASLATFNTLANIVAGCTGGTGDDCRALFAAVKPPGERRASNTLEAVHQIALNPANSVKTIFGLSKAPVYAPALDQAPSSWVLSLQHTDGDFNGPGRMAFDSEGNIWVTNNFAYPPPGTASGPTVIGLDPTGAPRDGNPFSGGGILGNWWGIAIDRDDRVWLSNFTGDDPNAWNSPEFEGGTAASLLQPNGDPVSGDGGYQQGPLLGPQGIAVDRHNSVWIASHSNGTVVRYPGGNPDAAQLISGGGLYNPFTIAIDDEDNAWVNNGSLDASTNGSVTKIAPDGQIGANFAVDGMRSPQGMAIDSQGDLWIASLEDDSVTWLDPDGTVKGQFRAPSIEGAWGVAIDGDDNVWVASFVGQKVTQLCGGPAASCPKGVATGEPISPAAVGFTNGGLEHITAVQVDQSGNVWAANNWSQIVPTVGGDGLVEFIGAAEPVRTPMIGPPKPPRGK